MSVSYKVWVLFKGLLLHWALGWGSLRVSHLREVPLFTTALWVLRAQDTLDSKFDVLGAHISGAVLKSWGA